MIWGMHEMRALLGEDKTSVIGRGAVCATNGLHEHARHGGKVRAGCHLLAICGEIQFCTKVHFFDFQLSPMSAQASARGEWAMNDPTR